MTHRSYQSAAICAAVLQIALFTGCSKAGEPEQAAPPLYKVRLDTSKGVVEIQVHRDWAPIGADHFYQLVKAGYYDGARFFRVVPNFVVQFGLAADPAVTKKWDHAITDDPVHQTNRAGTLVYAADAAPNSRTTQLFINLQDNARLDPRGFAPFGEVSGDGMNIVQQIYSGDRENPDQGAITEQGNAYLQAKFPNLDYIKKAAIE